MYPDGTGVTRLHTWNAGHCCGRSEDVDVDDVGFLDAVVADLSERLDLSSDRVVVAGHSNGAMMAQRWVAESPLTFGGVFSVAAVADPAFVPDTPTSFVHVHSVDDPRPPFEGGEAETFLRGESWTASPVMDVVDAWQNANGCDGDGYGASSSGDLDEDVTWTEYETYPVVTMLITLSGSGHAWPGVTDVNENLVGPPSTIFSANSELAAFVA